MQCAVSKDMKFSPKYIFFNEGLICGLQESFTKVLQAEMTTKFQHKNSKGSSSKEKTSMEEEVRGRARWAECGVK